MNPDKHKLADQFLRTFAKIRRLVDHCCDISLEQKIATLLQLQALSYLEEHKNATVGELAHDLAMSSSAIAQLTDRLVNAKRIERKNDPDDRRITRLQLTKEGREELQHLKKHFVDKISFLLSYISENDLRELIRIQTELSHKLEQRIK